MIALAAALLLQVQAPMPARISDTTNVPKVTLAEALKRAVGVDPDYIRTAGQIDVAEWGRRAAILAFIVPSLNVSVDATKYSDPFFNIGIGQPTANAVNFRADVNASGSVNATDIAVVKSRAGTTLSPQAAEFGAEK